MSDSQSEITKAFTVSEKNKIKKEIKQNSKEKRFLARKSERTADGLVTTNERIQLIFVF